MSAAIQQAAISYFGLPDGTRCMPSPTPGAFAFSIPLTEEHLRGIADRMQALAELPRRTQAEVLREAFRSAYNALSETERSVYGSFWNYCQQVGARDPYTSSIEDAWPWRNKS